MRIDRAIAALRADRRLQRRAQAAGVQALDAWRRDPAVAQLVRELDRFGAGAPLGSCPALEGFFTGDDDPRAVVTGFAQAMTRCLRASPFTHPPLRHGFDGAASTLLLARGGRAQLSLHACEPGRYDFAQVSYSDAVRFEAVIAGTGRGRVVRAHESGFAEESFDLHKGVKLALDLGAEALQIDEVSRRLVTLRLHRIAAEPAPTRAFDLASGDLVHRSCADLAASRREMIVAVLGRMGRAEAAPTMAAMAREPGEPSLRWQAMRECLALDTATGFAALLAVARSPTDPLAHAAGVLRAQLIEAHPQLLALENDACPA